MLTKVDVKIGGMVYEEFLSLPKKVSSSLKGDVWWEGGQPISEIIRERVHQLVKEEIAITIKNSII